MIILLKDNDLTKNTVLGGNIDVDKLRQCVLDAQVTRLEELLGETLYNKIEADFENEALTGVYLELYDKYIKPFLIRQSAVEYLKIGAFTVANNGIFQPQPNNAIAITDKNLSNLVNEVRIKADMFAERMRKFLCKNNIPEYASASDNIVNPRRPSVSGWFLENEQLTEDEWVRLKMLENR
jgi:hypothetical protein